LEGEAAELMESFFACATGVFGVMVETGALGTTWCGVRVFIEGREAAGFAGVDVDAGSEARGVARVVVGAFSVLGREVVEGRFAAVAVVVGAMVDLRSDGVARPAAVAPPIVRRTAGFLFSSPSPEVTDVRSGSASPAAALVPSAVRLAVVPAGARVGGLFRLDPVPARREVLLARGLDALLGGRVVVFAVNAAAGRRVAGAALPLAAAGRRGGTASFLGAEEAILRRRTDEGDDGGGSDTCCGLAGTLAMFAAALLLAPSLAEVLEPSAAILAKLPVRGPPARPRWN
jgi:hypothetical protein